MRKKKICYPVKGFATALRRVLVILIASAAFLMNIFSVNAQETDYLRSVEIPPTPTAASLGKYGNIPISYSTGTPQISIPIHTIESSALKLPVTLSYHASGVKVNEYASWVGMGWSLNAGGVITRVLKGRPDEESSMGFLDNAATMPTQSELSHFDQDDVNYMRSVADDMAKDTEPDIFYYNFGAYSGSFYFGNDGNVYTSPYVALDIRLVAGFFIVKTPDGTVYEFKANETSIDHKTQLYDFTSSWYLSKIYTADKKDEILLHYKPHALSMPAARSVSISCYYGFSDPTAPALPNQPREVNIDYDGSVIESNAVKLEEIEFSQGRIKFFSNTGRQDLATEYRLDSIQILYKDCQLCAEKIIKKYELTYFYNAQRLMLDKVTEVSPDNQKLPPHDFEYHTAQGNIEYYSLSQDHWGFYNGKSNTNLIPKTTFVPGDGSPPVELGGADRSSDESKMMVFSLRKISYPMGGYTEFDFGANKIIEQVPIYNSNFYGSATNIAGNVHRRDNTITIPQIQVAQAEITASFVSRQQLIDLLDDQGIELKCATSLFVRNVTRNWTITIPVDTETDGQFRQTVSLANFPVSAGDQVRIYADIDSRCQYVQGVNINLDASLSFIVSELAGSNSVERSVGGIRIKTIKDYDERDQVVSTKSFSYEGIARVFMPRYDFIQEFYLASGRGGMGTVECAGVKYKGYFLKDVSISSLGSGSSSPYVYGKVSVSEISGSNTNGKTIYYYDNSPDLELSTDQFSIYTSLAWRRGQLLKEEYYRPGETDPLKTVEYQYYDTAMYTVRGLKIARKGNFVGMYCDPIDYQVYQPFVARDYNHYCFWSYMKAKITRTVSGGRVITETENYSYENPLHLQLTRIVKNQSDGKNRIIVNKYPQDVSQNPAITKMVGQFQVGDVVETSEYKAQDTGGDLLVSRITRNFDIVDDEIVLKSVDKIRSGSAPVREVEFVKFDDNHNVTEYKTYDQGPVALIWSDDGIEPVAKFTNATRASVCYQGFEDNTGTLSSTAPTGLRYFSGSSYTIPSASLPSGSGLVMTFWFLSNGEWFFQKEVPFTATLNVPLAQGYDEIRVYPKGALVSTYGYKPGAGMVSVTDANNLTTYYEYDAFVRLMVSRDHNRNILKRFHYNYFVRDNNH